MPKERRKHCFVRRENDNLVLSKDGWVEIGTIDDNRILGFDTHEEASGAHRTLLALGFKVESRSYRVPEDAPRSEWDI
jgi:hypothetical protein